MSRILRSSYGGLVLFVVNYSGHWQVRVHDQEKNDWIDYPGTFNDEAEAKRKALDLAIECLQRNGHAGPQPTEPIVWKAR